MTGYTAQCHQPRCKETALGRTRYQWEPSCAKHALAQAGDHLRRAQWRVDGIRERIASGELEGQLSLDA